tara:strand:- start:117 stop:359 length:243 start_codon:yes stop_codon:yes gene_type:complete
MQGDWTGGLITAMSDFSHMRKSVIVDMIMVQLISLTLGCFMLIAFNSGSMDSTSLSYLLVTLFALFSFTGMVYRKFAHGD